jgi:hypothetical protein
MKSMTQTVYSFADGPSLNGARPADQESSGLPHCRLATGLRLQFHKASLGSVLNYLREAAGLMIHVSSNVQMERSVDLCRDQPVNTAEALVLLKQVLIETGCALIQKGSLLSIIRSQDLKKHCIPLPEL